MSHVKVYGLKFNREELTKILYKRYKKQSHEQSLKPMLCYLEEFLFEDLKKKHPNHQIELFRTGWFDLPGDECVIGVELSRYHLKINLPTEDPDKFENMTAYKDYTYGFKVHELKYLKTPVRRRLDSLLNDLTILVGITDVKPSTYKVENC